MSAADPSFARVQVLLPLDDADRFNAYCSKHGYKKSTLIARLVRDYLDRENVKKPRKVRVAPAPEPIATLEMK